MRQEHSVIREWKEANEDYCDNVQKTRFPHKTRVWLTTSISIVVGSHGQYKKRFKKLEDKDWDRRNKSLFLFTYNMIVY